MRISVGRVLDACERATGHRVDDAPAALAGP
jgi:hypothetical protein